MFVSGIVAEINAAAGMEIVGVAETGKAAVECTIKLEPDVLILDMQLPDLDGVEVATRVREKQTATNILPLTGYNDPEYILGLIEIGVDGYVLKSEPISSIIHAVRVVAEGGVYVSSEAAIAAHRSEGDEVDLSPTQEEVLRMVATGMTNGEIAEHLSRSKFTVRNHVSALREITSTHSRAELVAWAWRRGFVSEI